MTVAPLLAVLPTAPFPELAAGLATVLLLATTGTLTALAILIVGLLGERKGTRILFRHHAPPRRPQVRSAA